MAIPKRRKSSSARDKRRSHLHLEEQTIITCSNCGKHVLPHHACLECGYYKGKKQVTVASDKKEDKGKGKKEDKKKDVKKRDNKKENERITDKKQPEGKKRRLFARKAT
ncbi:50S ribosomal protein L32 [Patescibacteria group bacterium]|nr:50S ribosomal protein L32 [Patescibacteria group bacterium]